MPARKTTSTTKAAEAAVAKAEETVAEVADKASEAVAEEAPKAEEKKPATRRRTTRKAAPKAEDTQSDDVKEEAAAKPTPKRRTTRKTAEKVEEAVATAADKVEEAVAAVADKVEEKKTTTRRRTTRKTAPKAEATEEKADEAKAEATAEEAPKVEEKKPATRRRTTRKTAPKAEAAEEKADEAKAEVAEEKAAEPVAEAAPEPEAAPEAAPEPEAEVAPEPEPAPEPELPQPRRSVAFIGSECYPFVKTGGLGDVMYALPKALVKLNCDVKVILPNYACIKPEFKEKMVYKGAFDMDLCSDGRSFYVGIMEYESDGVIYDFIDNEEFFTSGNPYTNLVDDIPKYCYFSKAALAVLNYLDWIPDIIHCHDWQAGLVPVYLRTMFASTPLSRSKVVTTIHNLRFQGTYNIQTIKYWSNLPDSTFNMGALQEHWTEANMLKGGLAFSDAITTVSNTYAFEIQTPEYGEGLDAHLRHHAGKLRGIVNGIDVDIWNPATDALLDAPYSTADAVEQKKANKLALQAALGLEQNADKMVIGLVSRLTNQKGLDLVNAIVPQMIDGNTQLVVLGTGEPMYEDSFRYYENEFKGSVCSYIAYDEALSHKIYAAADAFLVPSQFEPCGLTQLIAMHYGTAPIVRETGGLKDTVEPYNMFEDTGNGFTFDRYDAGLLLDAINRAKTLYFENREGWDRMVIRDMEKDVSWANSAEQYRWLYLELT